MFDPSIHDLNFAQAVRTMRDRELSEAIKSERLARQSVEQSPVCRFLVRIGDLLIATGEGLRARYAPAPPSIPEVYCAEC
jgi:hypothetical protein